MADDTSIGIADDAERIEFDGAGDISVLGANLGIGTTSPSAFLHVSQSTVANTQVAKFDRPEGSNATNYMVSFENDDTTSNQGAGVLIRAGNDSGDTSFVVRDRGSNSLFSVRADGNVGIGTASPETTTHIATTTGALISDYGSAGGRGSMLYFGSYDGYHNFYVGNDGTNYFSIGQAGTDVTPVGNTLAPHFTVTGDGKVGIGTTAPTGKLTIAGASGVGANFYLDNHTADADPCNIIFRKSRNATIGSHGAVTNNDVIGAIYFQGSDGNSYETGAIIQAKAPADWGSDETDAPADLKFFVTADNSGTPTERFKISSTGAVSAQGNDFYIAPPSTGASNLNLDANLGDARINFMTQQSGTFWSIMMDYSDSQKLFVLDENGNDGVYMDTNNTSWQSNSDERIKENLVELDGALANLNTLRCVNFNMKHDKDNKRIGLIAQDVYKVYPEATSGSPDSEYSFDESREGNSHEGAMGLAYTELIAPMIKAIQELSTANDAFKLRIEALENA